MHKSNLATFNLVWPKGGSKRPAVVFIGAKGGGLTSKSVNCGNHGNMAPDVRGKYFPKTN